MHISSSLNVSGHSRVVLLLSTIVLTVEKAMSEQSVPDFAKLTDFVCSSSGGQVVFATDDFFSPCELMISGPDPVFFPDRFTEFGKWMDGWETRRKRVPGHDWCVLRLATKCDIKGVLVDTAFFTGNFAPKYSIQGAVLNEQEEAQIPKRKSEMGSAAAASDLKQMNDLSRDWPEIVPRTPLRPGYEDTRMNYRNVTSGGPYTHIRVNIYPDGGIARLRVFGVAQPTPPAADTRLDLASLLTGTVCVDYLNAHYGHPRNMLSPGRGAGMADGWETARRPDRPEVLLGNSDGTIVVSGEEWATFRLGFRGALEEIGVDTNHFKGNYPDSIKIEGMDALGEESWTTVLKPKKLSAHKEHWFPCSSGPVTHVRVTIAPDGGVSRLRLMGHAVAQ
ncbi:hypothetical protein JYU34_006950 [Plutella xylostella]|uniref:Allantoate amidinohydrolase n=1 Tax=Plutella xylostella TaxID=51655 RepID=A0ABQ7QT93_PLUXY|nr:hypothetical protein JYU34_006950 [Plutella xylostella]